MWKRQKNGVYTTPIFGKEMPNPLFNSLPNSPYLTNGKKLKFLGFIEGYSGITQFNYDVLFVVLNGKAITHKNTALTERNAIFSNEIFCEKDSIVLVFKPCAINENFSIEFDFNEEIKSNPFISKYKVYGIEMGNNIFFPKWSGLDYTFHAFTQNSKENVARGAHAGGFYQKNLVLHKGKIHMKTYFPTDKVIVETIITKTNSYYEGYYISGLCYHSFKALEESLDTIFVERNFGISMKTYPLRTLFGNDIICSARDGIKPTLNEIMAINNSKIIII